MSPHVHAMVLSPCTAAEQPVAWQAKYEPVDLSSSDPPTARRFAWAQLAYLNQGMSTREARKAAEAKFAEEAGRYGTLPATLLLYPGAHMLMHAVSCTPVSWSCFERRDALLLLLPCLWLACS